MSRQLLPVDPALTRLGMVAELYRHLFSSVEAAMKAFDVFVTIEQRYQRSGGKYK